MANRPPQTAANANALDRQRQRQFSQQLRDALLDATRFAVLTKTAAYTVSEEDGFRIFIRADATGGAFTVTLPPSNERNKGLEVAVEKIDNANTVTVAASSGDTLEGTSSLTSQYDAERYICDGDGNWANA